MPAFTASAPGKVILFGEHAVVYGQPAIAVPVTQVHAKATVIPNIRGISGDIRILAPDIELDSSLMRLPPGNPIGEAVKSVAASLGVARIPACTLKIKSTIPVASGLGSGAAVSVAVIRAMAGVTFFSAAYLAENVRGGLQAIPQGQIEAAQALGLNAPLVTALIVLPQALRIVIPAIVGQFISLFKDTTLVSIITLLDLLGIVKTALAQDPEFQSHKIEAYLFIAVIYFVLSYIMSSAARRIEASGVGATRQG